jgi:hypothetical protein
VCRVAGVLVVAALFSAARAETPVRIWELGLFPPDARLADQIRQVGLLPTVAFLHKNIDPLNALVELEHFSWETPPDSPFLLHWVAGETPRLHVANPYTLREEAYTSLEFKQVHPQRKRSWEMRAWQRISQMEKAYLDFLLSPRLRVVLSRRPVEDLPVRPQAELLEESMKLLGGDQPYRLRIAGGELEASIFIFLSGATGDVVSGIGGPAGDKRAKPNHPHLWPDMPTVSDAAGFMKEFLADGACTARKLWIEKIRRKDLLRAQLRRLRETGFGPEGFRARAETVLDRPTDLGRLVGEYARSYLKLTFAVLSLLGSVNHNSFLQAWNGNAWAADLADEFARRSELRKELSDELAEFLQAVAWVRAQVVPPEAEAGESSDSLLLDAVQRTIQELESVRGDKNSAVCDPVLRDLGDLEGGLRNRLNSLTR